MHPIPSHRSANNIVREHRFDMPIVRFRLFREVGRAEQTLLFSRNAQKNQSSGIMIGNHCTGDFENRRRTGGVIIGSRRVMQGVGGGSTDRIVMPGNEDIASLACG